MKKVGGCFLIFIFLLYGWILPANAADSAAEIEQLKGEVHKLLNKIEELEKKQAESETKAIEIEKKVADAEKKAVKAEKKSLKDRVNLSGEARFRIVRETGTTEEGFYGGGKPGDEIKDEDATSFPTRIRLNAHAEIVPNLVDVYARLTMNKRWGAYETAPGDPFDRPNSFESSIGHDMQPRFEHAYATFKIPSYNLAWYVGRLPGIDGPPSRQERSLFPRLFIDSEIDGTLLKWDTPHTALDDADLPWTKTRLIGNAEEQESGRVFSTRKAYEAKEKDRTGFIIGYLKYDERKTSKPDDADVYLAQAQIKIGKGTSIIFDGLYMDDWHMPRTTFKGKTSYTTSDKETITIPDLLTPYWLTGVYADTQLLGFQVYGAFYYSHFKIPNHTTTIKHADGTTTTMDFEGEGFPARIWYLGMNTGDLIGEKHQFCIEYAKGSDAWINPFNYRGFRRKGAVLQTANNYYYNPSGAEDVTVGFYPFNAGVLDTYYDYYYNPKVRLRLGIMDFQYSSHHLGKDGDYSILGSSKYEHYWWPYFEVNISF